MSPPPGPCCSARGWALDGHPDPAPIPALSAASAGRILSPPSEPIQSNPPRAVSYFFPDMPEPPVCFFNCSNHKREVSEQYEPGSGGKGEPPQCCRPSPQHRDWGGSAGALQGVVAVELSVPLSLLLVPSPTSRRSGESGARFGIAKGTQAPPAPIDRSARSCSLLLAFFSVCLQPLEGSCDESSLDRFQEQLKRSPGWGWEWEGSGAGQHQNAKWCSGQSWDGGTGSRRAPLEERRGTASGGSITPKLRALRVGSAGTRCWGQWDQGFGVGAAPAAACCPLLGAGLWPEPAPRCTGEGSVLLAWHSQDVPGLVVAPARGRGWGVHAAPGATHPRVAPLGVATWPSMAVKWCF